MHTCLREVTSERSGTPHALKQLLRRVPSSVSRLVCPSEQGTGGATLQTEGSPSLRKLRRKSVQLLGNRWPRSLAGGPSTGGGANGVGGGGEKFVQVRAGVGSLQDVSGDGGHIWDTEKCQRRL